MRRELQDVRNELRNARQLSGQTIEIFGAHMPSMAADLGTVRDLSAHAADPRLYLLITSYNWNCNPKESWGIFKHTVLGLHSK
mgnify:CR=1 FL=1